MGTVAAGGGGGGGGGGGVNSLACTRVHPTRGARYGARAVRIPRTATRFMAPKSEAAATVHMHEHAVRRDAGERGHAGHGGGKVRLKGKGKGAEGSRAGVKTKLSQTSHWL